MSFRVLFTLRSIPQVSWSVKEGVSWCLVVGDAVLTPLTFPTLIATFRKLLLHQERV